MHTRLYLALACLLLLLRVPSIVQPMGADQGLYAYIGERILAGELPYRDAWDQKPPAIHYTYALLRGLGLGDAAIPLADLVVAALTAVLLLRLGRELAGDVVGRVASLLFLGLSDPGFQRLAGVAVRAQCETFIALAVTAALVLLCTRAPDRMTHLVAGALIGLAAAFKYNAAAYGVVAIAALWTMGRLRIPGILALVVGAVSVPALFAGIFLLGGALDDLYVATVLYNLEYSGETYGGPFEFVAYLLSFPVRHARVDGLWLIGGAGCAVLSVAGFRRREVWLPVIWVAAGCLTIAANSSRGLPQYFVQVAPALALAGAWGGRVLWTSRRSLNLAALALVAFAVWRVNDFSNISGNLVREVRYLTGHTSREAHLGWYGDRDRRKYSALAMWELGEFLRARTAPDEPVLVFGFASGAYIYAQRASASRFFWSRPVIVDFHGSHAGYGIAGLRDELHRQPPAIVALQIRDWWPDVQNSADFFLGTPVLADWLRTHYTQVAGPAGYDIWMRRELAP